MPDWFADLITWNPLIQLGCAIWNWSMKLVAALFVLQPTTIGEGEPWAELTVNIYPVFLSVGVSLLAIFFLIGFCRESADLRQSLTFEKSAMLFLRFVAASFVVTSIMTWIPQLFSMAANLSIADFAATEFDPVELGAQAGGIFKLGDISIWFLSLIFLLAAAICGLLIVLTIYRRYLNLMLIVVMAPPALATAAGGPGLSRSAGAWVRTFLGTCFEIVVISIALKIGCSLIGNGRILTQIVDLDSPEAAIFEMIFSMVLLVGAVQGAEALLRRAFAF